MVSSVSAPKQPPSVCKHASQAISYACFITHPLSPQPPCRAQYFYSLYFSFVVVTGFGDNDLHDRNYIESIVIAAYLTASILLNAYILGE